MSLSLGLQGVSDYVGHRLRELVPYGVENWDLAQELSTAELVLRVVVTCNATRRNCSWSLSNHEIAMDGMGAVVRWMWIVREDLACLLHAPPARMQSAAEVRYYYDRIQRALERAGSMAEVYERAYEGYGVFNSQYSDEQDKRAKDLFKQVAGEQAFQQLIGGRLRIQGSAGTTYWLHPQATYCITRDKDGARFCAVVPGVPLWDHLLGIKLMVEHDEPRFLKTANKSVGAQSMNFISSWNEI